MPTKTTHKPKAKELAAQAKALGIKGASLMGLDELREAVANASTKSAKTAPAPTKAKKSAPVRGPRSQSTKPQAEKPAPAKATKKAPVAKKTAKAAPAPAPQKVKGERRRTPGGLGATKDSVRVTYPPAGVKKATEKVNPFRKGSNLHNVAPLLLRGGNRTDLATRLSEKVELHPYQKDTGDIDLLDFDKRILLGAQTMRDKFGFGVLRTGRGIEGTIKVFVPGSGDDPATKKVSSNGKAKKVAKAKK